MFSEGGAGAELDTLYLSLKELTPDKFVETFDTAVILSETVLIFVWSAELGET